MLLPFHPQTGNLLHPSPHRFPFTLASRFSTIHLYIQLHIQGRCSCRRCRNMAGAFLVVTRRYFLRYYSIIAGFSRIIRFYRWLLSCSRFVYVLCWRHTLTKTTRCSTWRPCYYWKFGKMIRPSRLKSPRLMLPPFFYKKWGMTFGLRNKRYQQSCWSAVTHRVHMEGCSLIVPTLSLKFQHLSHFLCCDARPSIQRFVINSPLTALEVTFLPNFTSDTMNIIGKSFS